MSPHTQLMAVPPALLDADESLSFWNAAQPDDLPASSRLFTWWKGAHADQESGVVLQWRIDSELRAVALVSTVDAASPPAVGATEAPRFGWVDGLVARAGRYRNQHRARLLSAAETWLRAAGCQVIAFGGGPLSLVRGALPDEHTALFMREHGYVSGSTTPTYDLAADVARYIPPAETATLPGLVRPAQPRDRDEVEEFLAKPFVIASTGEQATHAHRTGLLQVLNEGRVSDLMLLWTDDGAMGIAQVAFSDSIWPLELTYPWTLPRPWAALPLIAVREGQPDSAVVILLDGAMRRLHNNGINSCVAPGVLRTTSFEVAGFERYREWRPHVKRIDAPA